MFFSLDSPTSMTRVFLGVDTRWDPSFHDWLLDLAPGDGAKSAARKEVTLQTHGLDMYRPTLAEVLLPDGTTVNQARVKDGWCWWYRKYAPGDTTLERLEAEAREAKIGLWADPHPVPPWEWKKKK